MTARDPYATPDTSIDAAALAEYTAGVLSSRLAYEAANPADGPTCARCPRRRDGSNRLCWKCRKGKTQ